MKQGIFYAVGVGAGDPMDMTLRAKAVLEQADIIVTPIPNPLAKGMMIGLDGFHTAQNICRAVYEGVAFAHYTHICALLKGRKRPDVIRLAGGVANSKVWSQMFADVFGIPLRLIQDVELGAKGAAMAAGIGAGLFADYGSANYYKPYKHT